MTPSASERRRMSSSNKRQRAAADDQRAQQLRLGQAKRRGGCKGDDSGHAGDSAPFPVTERLRCPSSRTCSGTAGRLTQVRSETATGPRMRPG